MIVAAALCPAAPLLIPGVAPALAAEQQPLVDGVRRALDDVVIAANDAAIGNLGRLLVVTPGRAARWIPNVRADPGRLPFGRSTPLSGPPDPDPVRSGDSPVDLAPGVWIARSLLGRGPRLDALEVGPVHRRADGSFPDRSPTVVRHLITEDEPIGVVVLADGAICHGDDAPAAEDARAESFDEALHDALTADGGPLQLRHWCAANAELAGSLGATAPASLMVLAELLSGNTSTVRAEYFGHPYGVGYHVACWRR
ncbi:class III extradiol ring-cleavage dioxygenase family protein [Nakamurella lactea]|uniref:hypothetical protein n=1 Tax=Nakamurella lactea TaxID=459515 RepID=UPI00041B86E2|nr:hypothetical protein [Nakamurella lactea]